MDRQTHTTGLVLGKFMPLHNGHLALIRFAAARCRRLIVLVCTQRWEPIDPHLRFRWVEESLDGTPGIEVHHCTAELPYSDMPSAEISTIWGRYLADHYPHVEAVFTSESYGQELADEMGIEHVPFDIGRCGVPVSASAIRDDPMGNWQHIPPAVRPLFVKRVCLYGPESVGKSTLAEQLARRFDTVVASEQARGLIPDFRDCRYEDLIAVAEAQAREIKRCLPRANRVLFCDTDLLTTQVYSRFLFHRELHVEPWVEECNRYDLHLFCENDIPYIQDGTRLGAGAQPALREAFLSALNDSGQRHEVVTGQWHERIDRAEEIVKQRLFRSPHTLA